MIISITFDDLNAFAFLKSLYSGQLHTPNLDRVMQMGTTFENAYASAAVCNVSRTSVLSGLSPAESGVHFNYQRWSDPAATLLPFSGTMASLQASSGKCSTTVVAGDIDGDRFADFVIMLTGVVNLAASDFLL